MDNRGMVDNRGVVDNWGNSNTMSDGVVDSVSNWVSNYSMVDGMSNWVVNSMSNWVMDGMSNWVSNHSMSNMATMGDNSTMSRADHMGRHSRGRGSGSKAKKGGNNESLHFCSIT